VHPKFRTPYLLHHLHRHRGRLATGILPLQLLGQLVNIGTLLAFVLVCAGCLILRKTRPDLERRSRRRWCPWCRSSGSSAASGVMMTLPGDTWLRLLVWPADRVS
jgi:APA family basic amino acid/polyamine antiporter